MARALIPFAAIWLLVCQPIGAKPVKPLHMPELVRPLVELAGTTWEETRANRVIHRLTFLRDGTLEYAVAGKNGKVAPRSRGHWTLTGNRLTFDINNYSEHRGLLLENVIDLQSTNQQGVQWSMKLIRVPVK